MKKALSLLLSLCLIFSASPLCVLAESSNLTFTVDIEKNIYYIEDTFTVTINLTNNTDGFSALRGKLNYDSKNLTLNGFSCNAAYDTKENSTLYASYSQHSDYIQILWTVGSGLANYSFDGIIAELEFTVNKNADNKTYNFDFEFLDGTRYIYGEDFNDTTWTHIENTLTTGDSFLVNTNLDMLYFENSPTGAYLGESVSLDIAFSSNGGLYAFKTKLNYDKNSYEFKNCVSKNDSLSLEYNLKDGYLILLFDSNGLDNFSENSIIATVTFDVKDDASISDNSRFTLEYVDAVTVDFSNGVSINNVYFNALYCQFPLLSERAPVNVTLKRSNENSETITLYKGENLILPDTNFVDKNWYTDSGAAIETIFNETVCPSKDFTLYSSACAIDYIGTDSIVPYRFNQQFDAVKENESEILTYSSNQDSDTARMFRLAKLTDNKSYKLTITYKANIQNDLGFGVVGATGNNMYVNTSAFEGNLNTPVYKFVSTENYKTAEIFFTASFKGYVTDQSDADDTKTVNGNCWTYIVLIDENANDDDQVFIKDIKIDEIENSIDANGASILNEEAFILAGNKQAIRYYFSYTTGEDNNGEKISLANKSYKIVKRGFLFTNGATDKYLDNNNVTKEGMNCTSAKNNDDIVIKDKYDDFNSCWNYNSTTKCLYFSTYIINYTEDDYSLKLMVRAYVTFCDEEGNEFTIYSAPINRSISGIMGNSLVNSNKPKNLI